MKKQLVELEFEDKIKVIFSPIMEATQLVFKNMLGDEIIFEEPMLTKHLHNNCDISVIVGIAGQYLKGECPFVFQGMLNLSWPIETYLNIVEAMLGERHTGFNDDNSDVGAEVVNTIMGNAREDLTVLGYHIIPSIPAVIYGRNHAIRFPAQTSVFINPFNCQKGTFMMELCLAKVPFNVDGDDDEEG